MEEKRKHKDICIMRRTGTGDSTIVRYSLIHLR